MNKRQKKEEAVFAFGGGGEWGGLGGGVSECQWILQTYCFFVFLFFFNCCFIQ